MTSTDCRNCKKEVSVEADVCPYCGVNEPGVSPREKQLLYEKEMYKEHAKKYENDVLRLSQSIFSRLINKGEIKEAQSRANMAMNSVIKINKELIDLRNKLWRD